MYFGGDDLCTIFHLKIFRPQLDILFLAVLDSSIGDIVSQSVSQLVTFDFTLTTMTTMTTMTTKTTMTTVTTETAIQIQIQIESNLVNL